MKEHTSEFWSKLNEEQEKIIYSNDKHILVSAGPGSGKTHTLVRKISKDLEGLDNYHGVIACSFTKEASNQLLKKISQSCDVKKSFIGTIDAFVLSDIINPYKNRLLKHLKLKGHIDKLEIIMPPMKSRSSFLTMIGHDPEYIDDITEYTNKWICDFANSKYEISFPSYIIATKMIAEMKIVKDYIVNRYSWVYIDEAQDLNDFQIDFIKCLVKECNISMVLIGDKNQSIYEFRGARPEKFYSFLTEGFTEYRITHSVRCDKSILDFANKYIDSSYAIKDKNSEICVKLSKWPPIDFFLTSKYSFMVLFEDNDAALKCYNFLVDNKVNVILAKPIFINDADFCKNYFNILEESLYFYYNYDNGKFTYSIDNFKLFISEYIPQKAIKKIRNIDLFNDGIDFFKFIIGLNGEIIDESIIKILRGQLDDETVMNYYKRSECKNRVMTIHGSKGLEADKVIVNLRNLPDDYGSNKEYKRKLYVAFTRAKDELLIRLVGKCENSVLQEELENLIINDL